MMEQIAQSEFFYRYVAPNLTLVKFAFFFGIFGLVGCVAQAARQAIEAYEADEEAHRNE